ncbi:MAG: PEP-CTERM sorting domain-containing protein [Sedimentisphaerales bacterium]
MKKLITICLVLVLLAIAAPSNANIVAIGGTSITDSWSVPWYENGVGQFDLIAAISVAGSAFEDPGLTSSSWVSGTNGAISYISGPSADIVYFNTNFQGNEMYPTKFDIVTFNGQTIVDSGCITNQWETGAISIGGEWYILPSSWLPTRSEIPEPATIAILGLGALSLIRRKR